LTGGSSASCTIADKDLASIVGDIAMVRVQLRLTKGRETVQKNQADQAVEAVDAVVYEAA